jgi:hypothetical protein
VFTNRLYEVISELEIAVVVVPVTKAIRNRSPGLSPVGVLSEIVEAAVGTTSKHAHRHAAAAHGQESQRDMRCNRSLSVLPETGNTPRRHQLIAPTGFRIMQASFIRGRSLSGKGGT